MSAWRVNQIWNVSASDAQSAVALPAGTTLVSVHGVDGACTVAFGDNSVAAVGSGASRSALIPEGQWRNFNVSPGLGDTHFSVAPVSGLTDMQIIAFTPL